MSLKVIGTGFGRTSTDSMREALDLLGFGPCHHMREVTDSETQKRLWRALVKGAAPNWDIIFEGYASCVDWPSAFYWRELIETYPEAKVILTSRSPQSQWESFEKTIAYAALQQPGSRLGWNGAYCREGLWRPGWGSCPCYCNL
jgi:hypothetical protein